MNAPYGARRMTVPSRIAPTSTGMPFSRLPSMKGPGHAAGVEGHGMPPARIGSTVSVPEGPEKLGQRRSFHDRDIASHQRLNVPEPCGSAAGLTAFGPGAGNAVGAG